MRRALLILCIAVGWAGCANGPPIDGRSAYTTGEPVATEWLRAAVKPDEFGYHVVQDSGKLTPNARGDCSYWEDKLFAPGALPLAHSDAEIATHDATNDTPDQIRFKYRFDKLDLTVIESVNTSLIFVRGIKVTSRPEGEREAYINEIGARIINVKGPSHDWHFGPPQNGGRPGQDGNFTTDAKIDPATMSSWEDRADGGVMGGVLYFFLYKKNPNRPGYQNAQSWFQKPITPTENSKEE